jgi:nucleoside-diphosphate-sugar epimerase
MKIALTGSSGRVGSAILEMALAEGHELVCLDRVPAPAGQQRPGVTFIQADVADYDAFESAMRGCEALIHMAAIPGPGGHPDPVVHNNNVVGSYNALRAAAELGMTHVCQASSVNATGAVYSRWPKYDVFPLDETHATYNEDPYSLSKWICELQAESIARRYEDMTISSMRFHWVVAERPDWARAEDEDDRLTQARQLWGYTRFDSAASACLASLTAGFKGAEAFYIIAPDTMAAEPTLDLVAKYFPNVPVRGDLSGHNGFYDCSKAQRLLGWTHPTGEKAD